MSVRQLARHATICRFRRSRKKNIVQADALFFLLFSGFEKHGQEKTPTVSRGV